MMLIILEGVEGSGKSTVACALNRLLIENGIPAISTREPGGTNYAEKIRDLMLFPGAGSEQPLDSTRMMLAFASRKQHVEYVIKPSLAEGKFVVCDRFIGSSYVLQRATEHIDLYRALCAEVLHGLPEPLYVMIDITFAEAVRRRVSRGTDGGVIESEFDGADAHDFVTAGLNEFLEDKPNTLKIQGEHYSPEEIAQEILDHVGKRKHEKAFKNRR